MNAEDPKALWNNKEIEVSANLVPLFLWTTASIDVLLEGKRILKTGGKLKIIGSVTSEFEDEGTKHEARLTWGRATRRSFPYQLEIDKILVSNSEVFIQNWKMSYALWIIFGAVIGILLSHRSN